MLATLEPTQTTVADLTTKDAALKAMSQLVSVIVGAKSARITDSLRAEPVKRVSKCVEIALWEYQLAAKEAAALPADGQKKMAQVQRKMDSLQSLMTFAHLIEETQWD